MSRHFHIPHLLILYGPDWRRKISQTIIRIEGDSAIFDDAPATAIAPGQFRPGQWLLGKLSWLKPWLPCHCGCELRAAWLDKQWWRLCSHWRSLTVGTK